MFFVQNVLNWPQFEPLAGVEEKNLEPVFSFETWLNGSYQNRFETEFQKNLGSRPLFIRTHHQLFYSLFNQSKTYVVIGKNEEYFAYNYFPSFRGFDLKSKSYWEEMVEGLKKFQDTLDVYGIPCLVVIAPNKVRFMPENLPDYLSPQPGIETNWKRFNEAAGRQGLNVLDLNQVFLDLKNRVRPNLFPNTGTHWSAYGATLGLDSILRRLDGLSERSFVQLKYQKGTWTDSIIDGDTELAEHLNLWCSPSSNRQFMFEVEAENPEGMKPNVLFISDSYFWTINSLKLNHRFLSPSHSFWYYNNTNFDSTHGECPVDSLDSWSEILKRDGVVLMATESNLLEFPFGLLKDLGLRDE